MPETVLLDKFINVSKLNRLVAFSRMGVSAFEPHMCELHLVLRLAVFPTCCDTVDVDAIGKTARRALELVIFNG